MGIARRLAIAAGILAALSRADGARAASYNRNSYFITGSFSFDVENPNELNALTGGSAVIPGVIGGRLQVERGLFSPEWSHWVEFDYVNGNASAVADATYTQNLTYMTILPLGVNWWFARTAYVDIAASLGFGFTLAPSYSLVVTTTATNTKPSKTTETDYAGKLGPTLAARLEGRFWLSRYIAATAAGGIQIFSSPFTPTNSTAPSLTTSLTGISIIAGITWAIGGVQGTGRSFVEVIHDKPDAKSPAKPTAPAKTGQKPAPKPKPSPTQ